MPGVNRRQMLSHSAAAIAGVGLLGPGAALARPSTAPQPIPGGFGENFNIVPADAFFHVLPPGIGHERNGLFF